MTWNKRDAMPRQSRATSGTHSARSLRKDDVDVQSSVRGEIDSLAQEEPSALKTKELLAPLPTFETSLYDDDDLPMTVPDDVEREWNAAGMVSNRQWNVWAQWCRRGIQET